MSNPFNGKGKTAHANSGRANYDSREKKPPNSHFLSQDIMNSLKGIYKLLFKGIPVKTINPWTVIPQIMSANLTSITPEKLLNVFTTLKKYIEEMDEVITFMDSNKAHMKLWDDFCEFVDDVMEQAAKKVLINIRAEQEFNAFCDAEEEKEEQRFKALQDIEEGLLDSDDDDEIAVGKLNKGLDEYESSYASITYSDKPTMIVLDGNGNPKEVHKAIIKLKPKIRIITHKEVVAKRVLDGSIIAATNFAHRLAAKISSVTHHN